eukprot:6880627-Alexandrium_andersonii.AAC.1
MPIDRLAISKSTTHKDEFVKHVYADRQDQHTSNSGVTTSKCIQCLLAIASRLGNGRTSDRESRGQ